MSSTNLHVIPNKQGFTKWVRLPIDDLPLIRPPKRHMLAQMTGGLQELYSQIKKSRSRPGSSQKESPLQNSLRRAATPKEDLDRKRKHEDFSYNKDSKTPKYDGEHERRKFSSEDDDASLYTDEEGEFVPSQHMPLLAHRYKYVNVLARGQSALIIKALDTFDKNKPIAIKVLHRVYKPIGSQEADILIELDRADPWCHVPFTRLKNQFIYGPHYCLVFEALSPTPLYTHYKQKNVKGAESIPQVQNLCIKLLSVLGFLHKQNVIHADFKPENILLKDENDMNSVTVIDFGNSLRNTEEELSLYYSDFELQTLLYRAPEVIFGLKFSLEIDVWSLGCLLAECFIGQPLFIGKTKQDMLSKITKLLGQFPKEFAEGDCAHSFRDFIGTPLTQHQRVENLKKKLNCSNINFLLLLERLLAYSPQSRISPFEAASHSFVAKINPFLYLSSAGEKNYPIILLNSQTYPHLPSVKTNDTDDKFLVECRARLAMFSNVATNNTKAFRSTENVKAEKVRPVMKDTTCAAVEAKAKVIPPLKKEQPSHSSQHKSDHGESHFENHKFPENNDCPTDSFAGREHIPESSFTPYKESAGLKSPNDDHSDKHSVGSPELQHSFTSDSSLQSPISSPPLFNTAGKAPGAQLGKINNSSVEVSKLGGNKTGDKCNDAPQGDVSRTDVKQTLKSMGLRCEDFTISVYSREQAHAILRKQGVEVTNHNQNKINMSKPPPNRLPKINPSNLPSSVNVATKRDHPPTNLPLPAKSPPADNDKDDDDDDDCVILDPPEGAKKAQPPPPPPPSLPLAAPARRFPQQFQLMGTTVQVSRGAKRPLRGMGPGMPAKRGRPAHYSFFNEARPPPEENSEATVQDTLNRLKNYNISITCKRNATQVNPPKPYYKEDDFEDSDSHSDEEQDLAKFLECQLNEKNLDMVHSASGNLENRSDGSKENHDDDDKESGCSDLEENGQDENKCANAENTNAQDMEDPTGTADERDHLRVTEDKSACLKKSSPLRSPVGEESKKVDLQSPSEKESNKADCDKNSTTAKSNVEGCLSPSLDDDDINEELEKQLLESSNFGKDLEDMEDDGLDSLESEL